VQLKQAKDELVEMHNKQACSFTWTQSINNKMAAAVLSWYSLLSSLLLYAGQAAIKLPSAEACHDIQQKEFTITYCM